MSKPPSETSLDELRGQAKTLTALVVTLGVIIMVYAAFLVSRLLNGKWDNMMPLAVIPFMGIVLVTLTILVQRGSIVSAIKRRQSAE